MPVSKQLTLCSLFDGSGAFCLGALLAGIKPIESSEVEPFPILVTQKRLPDVKHYGDVSKLSGQTLEPVDIITFGSPCQDLSIAGKRAGIHDGQRSSLFFEAVRIIKERREETDGKYPRYIVWENVMGALSSNGGGDFKAVLEAIIGVKEEGVEVPAPENNRWPKADVLLGDGWSVAYRVLDSQYWGVPQRRARVYLVADFNGQGAGEVLFVSEGVSGYSPEGFRAWQGAAGSTQESTRETGGGADAGRGDSGAGDRPDESRKYVINTQGRSGVSVTEDQTDTIIAQDHGNHPSVLQAAGFSTEHSAKARSIGYEEEKSPTLRAGVVPAAMLFDNHAQEARYDGPLEESPTVTARYGTGGNNQPLVAQAESKAYGICSQKSHSMLSDNPHSGFYEAKTSRTLDRSGGNSVTSNQGGIAIVSPDPAYALQGSMIGRQDKNGPRGSGVNEEVSFTLNTIDREAVAFAPKAATLSANDGPKGPSSQQLGNPAENFAAEKRVYTASKASFFIHAHESPADTLVATDYKDPPLINDAPNGEPVYIVRRLTPTECARLQGFPDWWCRNLAITDPTEEQISFWKDVWNTWNSMNGKKPKTEKQIRKWLASPHTDSAEYKLWGNGCSLPVVYFVLCGIAWAAEKENAE